METTPKDFDGDERMLSGQIEPDFSVLPHDEKLSMKECWVEFEIGPNKQLLVRTHRLDDKEGKMRKLKLPMDLSQAILNAAESSEQRSARLPYRDLICQQADLINSLRWQLKQCRTNLGLFEELNASKAALKQAEVKIISLEEKVLEEREMKAQIFNDKEQAIRRLRACEADANHTMAVWRRKIGILNSDLQRLEEANQHLRDRLKEEKASNSSPKQAATAQNPNCEALNEKLSECLATIKTQADQLLEQAAEISFLRNKVSSLSENADSPKAVEGQTPRSNSVGRRSSGSVVADSAEIKELKQSNERLRLQLEQMTSRYTTQGTERAELQAKLSVLRIENDRLNGLTPKVDDLTSQLAKKEKELDSARDLLSQMERQRNVARGAVFALQQKLKSAQSEGTAATVPKSTPRRNSQPTIQNPPIDCTPVIGLKDDGASPEMMKKSITSYVSPSGVSTHSGSQGLSPLLSVTSPESVDQQSVKSPPTNYGPISPPDASPVVEVLAGKMSDCLITSSGRKPVRVGKSQEEFGSEGTIPAMIPLGPLPNEGHSGNPDSGPQQKPVGPEMKTPANPPLNPFLDFPTKLSPREVDPTEMAKLMHFPLVDRPDMLDLKGRPFDPLYDFPIKSPAPRARSLSPHCYTVGPLPHCRLQRQSAEACQAELFKLRVDSAAKGSFFV